MPLRLVLVLGDDADQAAVRARLTAHGEPFELHWEPTPTGALEWLRQPRADAILVLAAPQREASLAFLRELTRQDVKVPALLLTPEADETLELEATLAGAADSLILSRLDGFTLRRAVRMASDRALILSSLRQSEERFRMLVENSTDGIALVSGDGRLLFASRAAAAMLGHAVEEMFGIEAATLLHPEDLPQMRSRVSAMFARAGAVAHWSCRLRTREGDWREVEGTGVNRLDDPAIRAVIVNFRDVTTEQRIQRQLAESEERYRAFIEQSSEGIFRFEIDPPVPVSLPVEDQIRLFYQNGRLAECNDAMARMYDVERGEELVGARLEDLLPADHPENAEYLRRFINGGYRIIDAESREVDRQGRPKYFLNNLVGTVEGGLMSRAWGTQRDITERKLLEEQFRQTRKMETAGRLAGGIAHDFNNLLTAILGTSEILLGDLPEGNPHREDVEEIKRAANRAANLTRQLLAFSRRQVLQPKITDLNLVVSNVESMLRRLIGEDIDLVAQLTPELGRVKADPGQMEQVLMNLAVNARDAMPQGGTLLIETSNVSLTADEVLGRAPMEPGEYVLLVVSDSGVGMSQEVQQHLFEPFFTTKEPGKGTGLGLATVYGIVKQSGGFIYAYSELGRGSAFKIYLPRVEGRVEVNESSPTAPALPRGAGTVLLVEDEEAVRRLARRVLESRGYRVLEASHGTQALHLSGEQPGRIQLLVTDVIMPGMSGQDLARQLLARRPDLKVLFISGYTDEAIKSHGDLLPGTAFLQKPFTPSGLLTKVTDVLGVG